MHAWPTHEPTTLAQVYLLSFRAARSSSFDQHRRTTSQLQQMKQAHPSIASPSSRPSEMLTHVLPTIAICHTPLAPLVIASSWTVCCQRSRARTASDRELGSVQKQLSTRSIACKLKSDRCAANALAANMATNAVWMLSQWLSQSLLVTFRKLSSLVTQQEYRQKQERQQQRLVHLRRYPVSSTGGQNFTSRITPTNRPSSN